MAANSLKDRSPVEEFVTFFRDDSNIAQLRQLLTNDDSTEDVLVQLFPLNLIKFAALLRSRGQLAKVADELAAATGEEKLLQEARRYASQHLRDLFGHPAVMSAMGVDKAPPEDDVVEDAEEHLGDEEDDEDDPEQAIGIRFLNEVAGVPFLMGSPPELEPTIRFTMRSEQRSPIAGFDVDWGRGLFLVKKVMSSIESQMTSLADLAPHLSQEVVKMTFSQVEEIQEILDRVRDAGVLYPIADESRDEAEPDGSVRDEKDS